VVVDAQLGGETAQFVLHLQRPQQLVQHVLHGPL
jgi:hypothetical protein